jgi:acyl transferase domain-containing protein
MSFNKSQENSNIDSQLQRSPVAIIGMGCIFPQAINLQQYWENIVSKADCITDVPATRWSIDEYYDSDPNAADKTYCKRGAFLPDIDFNPLEFGLPPNILEVTDVSQMLSLLVAKQAMLDAGYGEGKDFNREQTGVILGVGGGQKLITPLTARLQYPVWEKVLKSSGLSEADTQKIIEKIKLAYIKWEENSFPGMLGNVIAGRIANRLDLGGINCVVDAACASSLSALRMALSELTEHRCDMMLTGGVDTDNSPFMYLCFSKTPAFSKQQITRPFDIESDGMLLGEGIGMMVLKRLEDAERDSDRIYAVIKGIGTSSDGKYKSIYAPRSSGQATALRRAYKEAGFAPHTVGLIEAHGTGTMAGDPAEFAGLNEVFSTDNPKKQHIALGSVKSQIGHTKSTAGAASLIKAALALHHKILPPTINITKPHPQLKIENSPFYLNTETRPWIRSHSDSPRRAGVSSFGFGGTNYHVVLEEYSTEHSQSYRLHNTRGEILLFASTPEQLVTRCQAVREQLQSESFQQYYAELLDSCKSLKIPTIAARVGFVAESLAEACEFLQLTIAFLKKNPNVEAWEHPQGIYYRYSGINPKAKIVALFSGQGSQYLEMGKELALNFPVLRQVYSDMDSLLQKDGRAPISDIVFPKPAFEQKEKDDQVAALQRTENTQPAIGTFSVGLYKILQKAGFKADFVAGHSFGELTALWAAGVFDDRDYFSLVKARGEVMASPQNSDVDAGAMLAVTGDISKIQQIITNYPQVTIANWNSTLQVVLAGTKTALARVQQILDEQGYAFVLLPVSAAFHTPLVSYAQKPFAASVRTINFQIPKIPIFSNITGNPYPQEPEKIRQTLEAHLLNPVLFKQEIENIYALGGYCFVEFGGKSILTNLVKNILGDRPHLAVALNPQSRRHWERIPKQVVCRVEWDSHLVELLGDNISSGGVCLQDAPTSWKKGEKIRLCLLVSDDSQQLWVDGEVIWLQGNRAGIKFQITPEEQGSLYKQLVGSKTQTPLSKDSDRTFREAVVQLRVAGLALNNLDPYLLPPTSQITQTKKGLNVRLNGSNYISEQTKAAFEEALQDGHKITLPILQTEVGSVSDSLTHQTKFPDTKNPSETNNGQQTPITISSTTESEIPTMSQPSLDYQQQLLASLERNLSHFQEHQAQILRVHEQYLKNQQEYSQNLLQMLQKQYSLLTLETINPVLSNTNNNLVHNVNESGKVISSLSSAVEQLEVSLQKQVFTSQQILSEKSPNLTVLNSDSQQEKIDAGINNYAAKLIDKKVESSPAEIDLAPLTQAMLQVVSKKTGYPTEMLELSMDMEADLGIDSIKRVEILGAMQDLFPNLPPVNPEELAELRTLGEIVDYMGKESSPAKLITEVTTEVKTEVKTESQISEAVTSESVVSQVDLVPLTQAMLQVVSKKTGYPTEMLELPMDMEADLGIDSIKRVEILGAMQDLFPNLPPVNPEELAELRTLGEIVEHMGKQLVAEKKN